MKYEMRDISKIDRIAAVLSGTWLIMAFPLADEIYIPGARFLESYSFMGVLPVFLAWGTRWVLGGWSLSSPVSSTQANMSKHDRVAFVLSGAWLIIVHGAGWSGFQEFLIMGVLPVFLAWGTRWIRGRWSLDSSASPKETDAE